MRLPEVTGETWFNSKPLQPTIDSEKARSPQAAVLFVLEAHDHP